VRQSPTRWPKRDVNGGSSRTKQTAARQTLVLPKGGGDGTGEEKSSQGRGEVGRQVKGGRLQPNPQGWGGGKARPAARLKGIGDRVFCWFAKKGKIRRGTSQAPSTGPGVRPEIYQGEKPPKGHRETRAANSPKHRARRAVCAKARAQAAGTWAQGQRGGKGFAFAEKTG